MTRAWWVVTVNQRGRVDVVAGGFHSRGAARTYILNRWQHIPPWAFATSIADPDKLQHKFGFGGL